MATRLRALLAATLPVLTLAACAATPPPAMPMRVASPAPPPPAFRDPARRTKIATAVAKLDAHYAAAAAKQKLPALAVGLVVDGDLVWSKGYGTRTVTENAPVDADTVFRIGSITKTFTALAALQLRDAGLIALDEPASKWVPELGDVVYPTSDSPPITMRELLTHTSGLPRMGKLDYADAKNVPTEASVAGDLRGLSLEYTPGIGGEYSNLGGAVAGLVVGRAAKMRYRDYVSAYLLGPLGMASTTWDPEAVPPNRLATPYAAADDGTFKRQDPWHFGASEGAGGLYSTVHDLARWAAMHLQAFPPRDDADGWPVKRATLREAMTTQHAFGVRVQSDKPPVDASASGIGFAWQTLQDCELEDVVWHNGATDGYSAMIAMLPARGVALVALTNVRDSELDSATLEALEMLAKSGAIAAREPIASPSLVDARDRLLRLFQRWDDGEAQQLFEPSFVEAVGGAGKMHELRDSVAQRLGACARAVGEIEVTSASSGSWRYGCEKGEIRADAFLTSGAPPRINGMSVHVVPAPSEALAKVAARIAALPAKWDDSTYEELLFPTFDRGEMRQFFSTIARDAGTCAVDRALDGDGATQAKWRLACTKRAMELEVTVDPKNGRVGQMVMGTAKGEPGHEARCPK